MLEQTKYWQEAAYIGGVWVKDAPAWIAVDNPETGAVIGRVPDVGAMGANAAIEAAAAALDAWQGLSAKARSRHLKAWYDLIVEQQEALANILTLEQGKPLKEARAEILYGASYIEWYAEEAKRAYGDIIPSRGMNSKILVLRQVVGVCAAITPWNFPFAMMARKAAPALAAGCTFVGRPASQTPFSALALAALAEEAGIPAGVFNMLTGKAEAIGEVFTTHKTVKKFSFTGSTVVGKMLAARCAGSVKKVSLELGGNAPFIVFDDANLDEAVAGAIAAKFRNAGQTCVCANRFFVQQGVYDEFLVRFVAAVERLNVGSGFDEKVNIGPLIDQQAIEKAHDLLQTACTLGARVLVGGTHKQRFFAPTVVVDVAPNMRIMQEEIFAPIAPIAKFTDENEVIDLANSTDYGLAAYFYSTDAARIFRVSDALEFGMVGVNTGAISNEAAPFGGVKESGLGREGSKFGLDEYLQIKYVALEF